MGHWSILCVCVCVFFCVIVVSKGPVSSTPSSSSSSSTTPGAAGAGASPSPANQVSPSLALPLAQGERGSSPLHPLFSHSSPLLFPTSSFHSVSFVQSFRTDTKRTKKGMMQFFPQTQEDTSLFSNTNYKLKSIYWNETFSCICFSVATVKTEPGAGTAVTSGPSPPVTAPVPTSVHVASAATTVKQEQGADSSGHDLIK